MIAKRMADWGAQGSIIREIAAYGDRRAEEVGAENVFNFTIGNPSVPAPACVAESIRRLLDTVPPEKLHAYAPAAGIPSVREKIARYLTESFGVAYRADDLYMTSGASSALAIVSAAILSPGDEMVTLAPYFTEYRVFAEAAGGKLVAASCDPDTFQIDLSAVGRAITEKTAAVLLNSPNNPSGVVLSRASIEALAALLRERSKAYGHTIYIVADEPYRELICGDVEVPFIPSIYPDTVYCYSFSKSLSIPGERVGYIALTPGMSDYATLRNALYGAGRALGYINVPSLLQLAVGECIGQTADLSVYVENRDVLYAALTEMGYRCVRPDGAFYLFLKAPDGDSQHFCQQAMDLDVLLVPGDEFGCAGYARLAYCVSMDVIRRSLPKFRALAEQCGLQK